MLKKIVRTIWINLPPSFRRMIVRATQPTFTVSVAAIIINEKGEVLLLDHVLRSRSSWGVPGGFLAHGEQPVAAVQRELREETGIEITSAELFRVRTVGGRHVEIMYRAEAVGTATVKSREINARRLVQTGRDAEKYESVAEAARRKFIEKLVCD
jgi:ADP-ribose pyrophosphatase YjhB (NUDIX family)